MPAPMRCVGLSPPLQLRAANAGFDPDRLEDQIFDDDSDEADAVDVEPATHLDDTGPLADLVHQAQALATAADPKLQAAIRELEPLVQDGANPVVFCRFIATAEHVAVGLRKAFPKLHIEVVTSALPPEKRRAQIEAMAAHEQRLLVATDCLSEGINLQALFDAVPSKANGICLCTGSLGVRAENDLPAMARQFAPRIAFAHLRATRRDADGLSFVESDHLDGDVDMIAVLKALLEENRRRSAGDKIVFRPDHGHRMLDDLAETKRTNPGYTAIGRLRGLAELRGAIRAIEHAG